MEKMNFVKNGVLRLPPGFRFHPTDEELVVQYLKRKVFACPLPASIIPEVDVCKADPWDLPGKHYKPIILFCIFKSFVFSMVGFEFGFWVQFFLGKKRC